MLCYKNKGKNELSSKEQSSGKQKESQGFIDNNQEVTVIHLEENEQAGLTENPQEYSSTQVQIEQPPYGTPSSSK